MVAAVVAATLLPCASHAQKSSAAYPERPIRLIALSSPGSGPDIVGRLIGDKLAQVVGLEVIVRPLPAPHHHVRDEPRKAPVSRC